VLGPAFVISRARLAVVKAPADGQVGQPVHIAVLAPSRVRVRFLDPAGPDQWVGPVARARRTARRGTGPAGTIAIVAEHRGVYGGLTVELASAAPFGLQWWATRVRVELPDLLHIAPRRGPAGRPARPEEDRHGPAGRPRTGQVGELRAARPYRPGDQVRQVHWPASAHTGDLMVRETESPLGEPVTVEVTLPSDPDSAERVAEQACGTVLDLLERDVPTILVTDEPDGPVNAAVPDRRQAGRRLARAVAAPIAGAPYGVHTR
jgi:uncharacterized protein (DUF58 family)